MSFVGGQVEYLPQINGDITVNLTDCTFLANSTQLLNFKRVIVNGGGALTVISLSVIGHLDWFSGSVTIRRATIVDLVISGSSPKILSIELGGVSIVEVNSSLLLDSPLEITAGAQITLTGNGTFAAGSSLDGNGSFVNIGRNSTELWVTDAIKVSCYFNLFTGRIGVAAGGSLTLNNFAWNAGTMAGPGSIVLHNKPNIFASSNVGFASGSNVQNAGILKWALPSSFANVPTSLGLLTNLPGGVINVTGNNVTLPVRLENMDSGIVNIQPAVTIPELANDGTIAIQATVLTVKGLGTCTGAISVEGAFIYAGNGTSSFACALQANELTIASGKLVTSGSIEVRQVYPNKIRFSITHIVL